MAPGKRKIFYGWWIVASCFFTLAIFSGVGMYGFGVFLKPLTTEFGWSRAAVGAMTTVLFVVLGLTSPFVGRLTERFGARRIMIGGALMASVGLALLSLTRSLWHLYAATAVLSLGLGGIGIIPTASSLANWFRGKRGTAMGIAISGVGFGALVLSPLQARLITNLGWRQTYLIMAIATLGVVILASLLIRNRPEEAESVFPERSGPAKEASPSTQGTVSRPGDRIWTLGRVVRSWTFWLVVIAFCGPGLAAVGLIVHQVAFLNDRGLSIALASTVLGFTGGMGGLGKLTFGYLSDRIPIRYVVAFSFGLQALGVIFLMQATQAGMLWLYVVPFGLGMGAAVPLQAIIIGEYFGVVSFATILGVLTLVVYLMQAAGPFLAGLIYDATGSYSLVFVIFLLTYVVSAAIIFFVRGPMSEPVKGSPPVAARHVS